MRFLEILFGVLLFPLFLILGLFIGIVKVYQIYDEAAVEAYNKRK